ncbi:MAG: tRNA uridine(34) 5-carboxymethylaminomethyl modification radical SAM/GNAT enzyme Elp3 [Myxococcota bacterium]|nr:tRNA uridine(34) 5-carboxymethylaminomethyl modification radical SAM/GNAT enzyme Elp3 [Myxococcota bacterium]
MAPARRRSFAFDPRAHEPELVAILERVAGASALDARSLDRLVKRHPRAGRGLFRKSELLAGYRALGGEARFGLAEPELRARLRLRPVRTLSGVTPVTVLTRPHPCPGRCIFCPNDVRMPKSYLADEPGAQRAEDNGFDPYLQTWTRLAAYRAIGHPTDKVELIVLGGTWSFHPEPYQRWFVKRCLDALNDFGGGADGRGGAGAAPARYAEALPARLDGRALPRSYNQLVGEHLRGALGEGLLHVSENASWDDLAAAQRANEGAGARCVGLSLETRPDHVDEAEATRLRRLGATKVQLGVQSLSDDVLDLNRRGHDVAASRRAVALLRRFGFKVQAHWMPNLAGSTPQRDVDDFARLFADEGFRPDELKLYPCVLIPSAELAELHARGEWRPYGEGELLAVVAECLARVPRWCRVTRVIRDFSAGDIAAGSRTANLREVAERRLRDEGRAPVDVRAREIRGDAFDAGDLALRETAYATSAGEERFLEFTAPGDRLVAFLRLSLPAGAAPLPELAGAALVREVHVYGGALELGRRGGEAQHRGLGRRLLERAATLAGGAGLARLAVISAVGTRAYYRGLGFRDGGLYQHLELPRASSSAPRARS